MIKINTLVPRFFGASAWYDATNSATLWQDTARTSAVTTSGQTVKTWDDLSGNANHLSGASAWPTYLSSGINSVPAVNFNGSQQLTRAGFWTSAFDTALTVYAVLAGGDSGTHIWLSNSTSTFDMSHNGASQIDGVYAPGITGDGGTPNSAALPFTHNPMIVSFAFNGSQTRYTRIFSTWRGGNMALRDRYATHGGTLNIAGNMHVGSFAGSFGHLGKIGELIIVNRMVSDGEDAVIFDWLANKWAIQPGQYVLCVGDSLTDTVNGGSSTDYPTLMQAALGASYVVEKSAYGGRVLRQMFCETGRVDAWRAWSNSTPPIAFLHLGENDLVNYSNSAATNYAQIRQAALMLGQQGYRVIVCTPTPTVSVNETIRQQQIALQRAGWRDHAVGLCDFAADSRIGAAGANTNETYFQADHVHYNAAGCAVQSEVALAALTAAMATIDTVDTSFQLYTDQAAVLAAASCIIRTADGGVTILGQSGTFNLSTDQAAQRAGQLWTDIAEVNSNQSKIQFGETVLTGSDAGTLPALLTIEDVQTALTNQGYTEGRGANLDNLNAAVSSCLTTLGTTAPANWIDAASVKADAVAKMQAGLSTLTAAQVWDYLTSAATTAGSIGKRIVDFITTLAYPTPTEISDRIERAGGMLAGLGSPMQADTPVELTAAYDAAKNAASETNATNNKNAIIAAVETGGGGGDGDVVVNHNYGGTDALRITEGGIPKDGAVIRAYVASAYDAGSYSAIAKAVTGSDGRWITPMMLDPDAYVLVITSVGTQVSIARITVT